jgi:hypothetical protein
MGHRIVAVSEIQKARVRVLQFENGTAQLRSDFSQWRLPAVGVSDVEIVISQRQPVAPRLLPSRKRTWPKRQPIPPGQTMLVRD